MPPTTDNQMQPMREGGIISSALLGRRARKRERNRLWMARWRSKHPELARQRGREWDAKHPGKNAEQLREYYRRHKEKHTEKVKLWQRNNQEMVRGYVRKSM